MKEIPTAINFLHKWKGGNNLTPSPRQTWADSDMREFAKSYATMIVESVDDEEINENVYDLDTMEESAKWATETMIKRIK